jgi:4-alpha-glucanotransferase
MSDDDVKSLHALADAAGVSVDWQDAAGKPQRVSPDVLRNVLNALGIDASSPEAIDRSLDAVNDAGGDTASHFVIGVVRQSVEVPLPDTVGTLRFRIEFDEDGGVVDGEARRKDAHTVIIPGMNLPGYHTLHIGDQVVTLAIAPTRCFGVSDAIGKAQPREWALAVQLYGLRRRGASLGAPGASGGVGDFTALASLAGVAAKAGATGIAISPVHAMFTADPQRISPYAPSSRLFLNVLYVDPAEVFGQPAVALAASALGLNLDLARLEQLDMVDWPAVARTKLAILRRLFDGFPGNVGSSVHEAFTRFREEGGSLLENHARFEALHAWRLAEGFPTGGWRDWPECYQNPDSPEVAAFAQEHAADVTFHAFLQWLADRGLARAQAAARDAGMGIGLIADLAVGTDPGGSHAWSRQGEILAKLSPGAPPDLYNAQGQAWGLTAFSPSALRRTGYRAYIEMLRACLRHAGGIRIDHALGLKRMWLVPEGAAPTDGAYVNYPFDDIMRLIALESWRHRAIVVGENLGTVPEGFNDQIGRAGMLGMDVLWFERAHGGENAPIKPPRDWPVEAMAMTTTHDLPTIAGWWTGTDLQWRDRLGLFGDGDSLDAQMANRARDREQLVQSLAAAGIEVSQDTDPEAPPPIAETFRFVGATSCPLAVVPLEDVLGDPEAPNLPGTTDTHPNWRRRMATTIDTLLDDQDVSRRLAALSQSRQSS